MVNSSTHEKVFQKQLRRVQDIGREIIAPQADDVDKNASFPHEAFEALKSEKLLSAYIPKEYGGMGLSMSELGMLCRELGKYCGSTAMIYAMHQIQVACIVHHHHASPEFLVYMGEIVKHQHLIASATTEIGVGGDLRSSICALEMHDDRFTLNKEAPVISYVEYADALMLTCRRNSDAPANDQVQVLLHRSDFKLREIASWDTLGFRGTCSQGFSVASSGDKWQIQPVPFGEILHHTMHPVAHILWSSLWVGIAEDAFSKAKQAAKKQAGAGSSLPIAATRLAETGVELSMLQNSIEQITLRYEQKLAKEGQDIMNYQDINFIADLNNLKLICSEQVIKIVGQALMIVGINGYRNDSESSLCRHLRDAYGTSLMVNNDRILSNNATLYLLDD